MEHAEDNVREFPDAPLEETDIKYPSGFRRFVIVLGILFGVFVFALDISIISTAIPRITSEFNSLANVGWYGSAFFLTLAATQSVWGKLYQYFSLRGTFIASVVIFEVGSLICALAPNSPTIIAGRAIQGMGGSGSTLGSYAVAAFIAPPQQVPIIIGLIGCVFSIASVVGPLLGGVFTQDLTWRWCFWINLPIGAVTVLTVFLFFQTPPHAKPTTKLPLLEMILSFDPLGVVLLVASLICYFLVLQWGGIIKAWNSSDVIGLLIGWLLLSAAFVVNEWWQKDRALVVLRMWKVRSIAGVCAFVLFLYGAYFAILYNIPTYFQAIKGLSPQSSGVRTIPMILATSATSLISSLVISRVGIYQPFLIAGAALASIGAGFIYTFDLNTSLGKQIGYQIIFGVGTGVVQIPAIVGGTVASDEDKALALSTVCVTQFFAAAYVIAATDSITNNLILANVPRYAPEVNPQAVISAGTGNLEEAFQGATLHGIREAYNVGLRGAWALIMSLFCISFFCAFIPKWPGCMVPDSTKEEGQKGSSLDEKDDIEAI
ncbi:Putative HC-toxin efflux carrier TOXA [Talaromyces islandicus]|uniref:Putative HC-toxin efflux carrier TOXA n=1 Tax=Talaromyces islandicus TaxID=28573 RepID=A0A0U1MBD6_TALIS|nr:Putative HC-toxin efflux carrier TOXA [Talaromyces islandicus]